MQCTQARRPLGRDLTAGCPVMLGEQPGIWGAAIMTMACKCFSLEVKASTSSPQHGKNSERLCISIPCRRRGRQARDSRRHTQAARRTWRALVAYSAKDVHVTSKEKLDKKERLKKENKISSSACSCKHAAAWREQSFRKMKVQGEGNDKPTRPGIHTRCMARPCHQLFVCSTSSFTMHALARMG